MSITVTSLPKHGSPQDRGSADAYYGRPYNPHFYPNGTYKGRCVTMPFMTKAQIEEYQYGYENETDSKDWGVDCSPHCECDTEED